MLATTEILIQIGDILLISLFVEPQSVLSIPHNYFAAMWLTILSLEGTCCRNRSIGKRSTMYSMIAKTT